MNTVFPGQKCEWLCQHNRERFQRALTVVRTGREYARHVARDARGQERSSEMPCSRSSSPMHVRNQIWRTWCAAVGAVVIGANWCHLRASGAQRDMAAAMRPSAPQPAGKGAVARPGEPEENILGFVAYCGEHGIKMARADTTHQRYVISEPSIPGVQVSVYFYAFKPGTSAAEVRHALRRVALAFPYLSEDAGLAMSAFELRGVPDPKGDAPARVSGLRERMAKRFDSYRPAAGPTTRDSRTTGGSEARPGPTTGRSQF